MSIFITKGDVTEPIGDDIKVVCHVCNSSKIMGAGVAAAISKKWPHTRKKYLEWGTDEKLQLGDILIVNAETDIFVAHMVGQKECGGENIDGIFVPPIRYESVKECLLRLSERTKRAIISKQRNISIHSPLIGCQLAGGTLERIYPIIDEIFHQSPIEFYLYAFTDDDFADLQSIAVDAKVLTEV